MTSSELILVVVASLVGSFVKSVTGMGYPLLAVPFLSLFIGVQDAVVIIAFPNTVANLLLNVESRHARKETRNLVLLGTTMVIGAVVGTLLLVHLPEKPLVLTLAATIVVFVVRYFRRPDFALSAEASKRWSLPVGATAGVMQGAIGISGPIIAMWLHGYRLTKDAYVYAVTMLFFLGGAAQLIVLIATGEYDSRRLVGTAFAFVAAVSMVPVGTRLRSRIAGEVFERLVMALLAVSATSLLIRSLS